jgi:hypothetical protein
MIRNIIIIICNAVVFVFMLAALLFCAEPLLVTKRGSITASRRVNGRVWNGNIHRKTDAYSFVGLTRGSTGTLLAQGHNNKQ